MVTLRCLARRTGLVAALVVLSTLLVAPPQAYAQESPLATLVGSWSGTGRYTLADGKSARIQCSAYYTGGAAQLGMAILCKSDAQNIEMRTHLNYSSGRLSGHWEERTYNAQGDVNGHASNNRINLTISGAITGSMIVDYSKTRHTVTISTSGTALKSVTVTLQRS